MQNQINIYCKKVGGRLEYYNKHALKEWISNLTEGEDIVIKFNVSKNFKSTKQLRLVYACFRELSDKLGYSVEEIKTLMKLNQGLCGHSVIEGEEIHFCKSIADLSRKELSDFISKMDIWASKTLNMKLLTNDDINFLNNI